MANTRPSLDRFSAKVGGTRRKKISRACANCRQRKTRCFFDISGDKCRRCREELLNCEVREQDRRGGYANVIMGRMRNSEMCSSPHKYRSTAGSRTSDIPKEPLLRGEVLTGDDAASLLNNASSEDRSNPGITTLTQNSNDTVRIGHPLPEDNGHEPETIQESSIVRDNILTAEAALRFVSFFFDKMAKIYHPFFPHEFRDPDVLCTQPALLTVVCAIGARCQDKNVEDRLLHKKLWIHYRETVSRLLWDCPDSQVRSVVSSVILLCEWLPAALLSESSSPKSVLRKHSDICWPLVGQTIRFAGCKGLLDHDIGLKIALHFADHNLACRLGQQPMLGLVDPDEELPENLVEPFFLTDYARLGIVKILNYAQSSLYSSRKTTYQLIASGQHVTILNFLLPQVNKWKEDFQEIERSKDWTCRSVMHEFSYLQLYLFSIVLVQLELFPPSGSKTFLESYKFLYMAVEAATYIVDHESSPECPVDRCFSPVSWISRLLHASVFLAKTILIGTVYSTLEQQLTTLHTLSKASDTMATLPPEGLNSYSKPLKLICEKFLPKHTAEDRAYMLRNGSNLPFESGIATDSPVQRGIGKIHQDENIFSENTTSIEKSEILDFLDNESILSFLGDTLDQGLY